MATGALAIASKAGGLAEIVEDGVTWLVPPGDSAALAERIRHAFSVLADPDAAQQIRRAAAARAAEHDVYTLAPTNLGLGTLWPTACSRQGPHEAGAARIGEA